MEYEIGWLIKEEIIEKVYNKIRKIEQLEEDSTGESSIESYTIYEDDYWEKLLRNYWLENGYEINISEINRIQSFGVENEIMKTREFMENYMTIKELNDEEIVKELKKWYNENALEYPICNKMLLIKKAIEYEEEFIGKICNSCFEKKKKNREEKRVEKLRKIFEKIGMKITEEEVLRLINMGYIDKEILKYDFIKLF